MTLFLLFLLLHFTEASDQGPQDITAHLGQNVTLPCRAPNSSPIRAAEWSRPDLGSKYVFFYRDEQADITHQHPSFENRVELVDSRLKDGDLSVILKTVRHGDAGKYECRVKQAMRRKRAFIVADPVSIVNLHVTETRRMAENTGNGQHTVGRAGLFLCLLVFPLML